MRTHDVGVTGLNERRCEGLWKEVGYIDALPSLMFASTTGSYNEYIYSFSGLSKQ